MAASVRPTMRNQDGAVVRTSSGISVTARGTDTGKVGKKIGRTQRRQRVRMDAYGESKPKSRNHVENSLLPEKESLIPKIFSLLFE